MAFCLESAKYSLKNVLFKIFITVNVWLCAHFLLTGQRRILLLTEGKAQMAS